MRKSLVASLFTSMMLGACGGGGGDSTALAPVGSNNGVEGAYQGTTSRGADFTALVLDNGLMWAIYGQQVNSALYVEGVGKGVNGVATGSGYSTAYTDYYYTGAVYSGALSANVVGGQSFNGTVTSNGLTATFAATAVPATAYDYNRPANLGALTGLWPGVTLDGQSGSIAVASNGAFTGSINGCVLSGQFTPRATGKNVFDVSVSFGAAPCTYAGQSAVGNAVSYATAEGATQLIVAATSSDGSAGSAFLSQRRTLQVNP